jgi:hypothetical protein
LRGNRRSLDKLGPTIGEWISSLNRAYVHQGQPQGDCPYQLTRHTGPRREGNDGSTQWVLERQAEQSSHPTTLSFRVNMLEASAIAAGKAAPSVVVKGLSALSFRGFFTTACREISSTQRVSPQDAAARSIRPAQQPPLAHDFTLESRSPGNPQDSRPRTQDPSGWQQIRGAEGGRDAGAGVDALDGFGQDGRGGDGD